MPNATQSDSQRLLPFFTHHLNRVYYGKAHLVGKLPELLKFTRFKNLGLTLEEMKADVQRQMARIELIFTLLDLQLAPEQARTMYGLIQNAYDDITTPPDHDLMELSLIYYLEIIEGIEMSCFKMLRMAAVKIKNKQIKQLLKENYDEAKENRTLLLLLATEYIIK